MNKFKQWSGSNSATAKCTRTIFHGIVSALITYLPDIISGYTVIPNEYKPLVMGCMMAVLSPIQAMLGSNEGGDVNGKA